MNKIVELLVDWDNIELDDLGVDVLSLVENPAIQIGWMAFKETEVDPVEAQTRVLEMASQEEFGTFLDPETTIFIDTTQEEFADAAEIGSAIEAVDRLDNVVESALGVVKYRYAGRLRTNSRNFCRTMIGLNKIYSPEELVALGMAMSGVSSSIYPDGTGFDIQFVNGKFVPVVEGGVGQWMGGPNCGHYWQMVREYPSGVVEVLGRAEGDMGIPMRDRANNGYRMSSTFHFSDDDQMIVTGPAMVADQKILRMDEDGNPFHVFFSADTIKKIAQKFLANSKHNNTDINHDGEVVQENTLLESWIVEDPEMDKSKRLGYDVPVGTWFVSLKINNKDTWEKIKSGELTGYSVEGSFLEKLI